MSCDISNRNFKLNRYNPDNNNFGGNNINSVSNDIVTSFVSRGKNHNTPNNNFNYNNNPCYRNRINNNNNTANNKDQGDYLAINHKRKASFLNPVNSLNNIVVSGKLDLVPPFELKENIGMDSSQKSGKRSKPSETMKLSIPRDLNPPDITLDRDDPVPIELWNDALQQSFPLIPPSIIKGALDIFRHFCLRWWRIRIRQELFQWHFKLWSIPSIPVSLEKEGYNPIPNWRNQYTKEWLRSRSSAGSTRDWEEGRDCLIHCMGIDPLRTWGNLLRARRGADRGFTVQKPFSASIPRG